MKNTLTLILSGLLLCGCSKKQATNDYPKESLTFAGYATPDSALESYAWGYFRGDKTAMLQALTPEAQKEMSGKTDSEIKAKVKPVAEGSGGYTIQKRETISDGDIVLYVSFKGINQVTKMELKKIGNDWKVAGSKND